ncbi:MAG TPA: hypothetical protein VLQ90_07670 [Pyrinomonadaceae bacterium]|nr:hypothetical protein [Pyrinomonadaceae bacterium]
MLCKPIPIIKKTLWLLLAALCTVATASAQQSSCSAKIDQLPDAPELRGFHLGMTYDQVKARVPPIQFGRADQFGVAKTSINPSFGPQFDKASFADVRTISLDFLDGKLVTLWIGYESTFKWQKLDEFVAGMSKVLNLPAAWPPKRGGQELRCDGFSVLASVIAGSPGIRISEDAAQEIIANRREAAAAATEAAEAAVIGDQRTKVYYPSDCSERERVPEASRVTFKDKDEAEKAGYKLAKDCQ